MPVIPILGLKAIKHPPELRGESRGGRGAVSIPRRSNFTPQPMDQHLSTQQHLNNLRAFESYEQRLRAAYKRATTPERSTDEHARRLRSRDRG
jgi:hypothetical protein